MQGTVLHLFGRFEGPFMRSEDPGSLRDPFGSSEGPVGNSEDPFSSLRDLHALRVPPHVLRGPGHALRGAPVAQGPLRYYQGAPLVALFHPKGPQGPSCAQGALSSVQRGPVAHSGAVGNYGPFISLRGPFGSTEDPFISSGALLYVQRGPVTHSGPLGSQGPLQLASGSHSVA